MTDYQRIILLLLEGSSYRDIEGIVGCYRLFASLRRPLRHAPRRHPLPAPATAAA